MSAETDFSRWLRDEMPRRGYPLAGPRAGGISRLAQDTGISQATMSRVVGGKQKPTLGILEKIGNLFGVPLGEMMIHAGLAKPDAMVAQHASAADTVTATGSSSVYVTPPRPDDFPGDDRTWRGLPAWQHDVWLLHRLTPDERDDVVYVVEYRRHRASSRRQAAAPEQGKAG